MFKKCPNCDGVLDFDPETGGLVCPYCGYKKEIEESEKGALDNFKSWLKRKLFCPKKAKEFIKTHINSKITEKIKYDNNADRSTITNVETVF